MADIEKVIKGLEWILEDDRFGFGQGWSEEDPPRCEEEQAGYNIEKAIELLKEQNGLAKALEQANATINYLNDEKEKAIKRIEALINGRSKPLESASDREDMDRYHGDGYAERRDCRIAGLMTALDIIKGKAGEQE